MFKKIKCLLLSGVVALGLTTPVFADELYDQTLSNYRQSMEGVGELDAGNYKRVIDADDMVTQADWKAFVKAINDNTTDCLYAIYYVDDNYTQIMYDPNNDGNGTETIETVEHTFNTLTSDLKGTVGIVKLNPSAGDVRNIVVPVIGLTILGGVLVVVNKKRK